MSSSHEADSDMMGAILAIRKSEGQAEHTKAESKVQAEHILHKAKQEALLLRNAAHEESVKLKNHIISEGTASIESEVEQVLSEARKEGSALAKKSIGSRKAAEIIKDVLFGQS